MSVAENLGWAAAPTDEELAQAIDVAAAQFVSTCRSGLDTRIGEQA